MEVASTFVDVSINIQIVFCSCFFVFFSDFVQWTDFIDSCHIVVLCDFTLPAISLCLLTSQLNSLNIRPVLPAFLPFFLVDALFMDKPFLSLSLTSAFLVPYWLFSSIF